MRPTLATALAGYLVLLGTAPAWAEPTIDFARDIRPLLSDTCFTCHGPDEGQRKAELRLDLEEDAYADRGGYRLIVPGKPGESELYQRLTSSDPELRMPPADSGRQLNENQIATIRRWIEQGAKWQQHWSFVTPQRPPLPKVSDAAWPANPIDHFILARLDEQGLQPSPQADKTTLLRRVTLDLTGLPPTLEEIDAFLADDSPQAYERVVDRLLGSPHYGEHQALAWLDAARYGDSNGYQRDATRTMWPWRDWVVAAMNDNLPFDQFTIQQLAGDLLPGASLEQRVASGFNRNHMLNGEGGRIAEESRVEYVVDRVDTTSTVWMGLTIGCARCHDHKYDPVSQREFYQIYAYFNSINETGGVDRGGNASPVIKVPREEDRIKLAELETKIKDLTAQAAANPDTKKLLAWQQQQRTLLEENAQQPAWTPLTPVEFASQQGATLQLLEDASLFVSGTNPDQDVYTVKLTTGARQITGIKLEALLHESFTDGALARSDSGNFVLTDILIQAATGDADPKPYNIRTAVADYEQGGFPVKNAFDQNAASGWAVYKPGDMQHPRTAVFTLAEPIPASESTTLTVTLKHLSPHRNHNLGRFRLSVTSLPEPTLEGEGGLPADLVAALTAEQPTDQQQKLLADRYRQEAPEFAQVRQQLAAARKQQEAVNKSVPETMVMQDLPQPRSTYVLQRGQYDMPDKQQPVGPGIPSCLTPLPEDAPANRLTFARWLVDRQHPLTARVTVNRYWQQFFGTGLVKTTEDFGVQGEPPPTPQLLDWLAVEFVESGWDVKRLHKLLVMSSTYRQSSQVTEASQQKDPFNRLLSRAPRLRLSSFAIRDQALALAGLLSNKLGGPPVKPYQPDGVWADFSLGKIKYQKDSGESLYRRSLYTFWRRSVGPTMLFDTSARQVCVVRQARTNTPLHALTLLNDITFVEAARKFAERAMREGGEKPQERITYAFRLATARKPSDQELDVLTAGYERTLAAYRQDPQAANQILTVGDAPRDESLDSAQLAAYTGVMSVLLNLDEVITKE